MQELDGQNRGRSKSAATRKAWERWMIPDVRRKLGVIKYRFKSQVNYVRLSIQINCPKVVLTLNNGYLKAIKNGGNAVIYLPSTPWFCARRQKKLMDGTGLSILKMRDLVPESLP